MKLPLNASLFRFPGYGPDLGHGLLVKTQEGRVLITEAATNPGVPLVDSISAGVEMAARMLGVDAAGLEVYVWTPDDPLEPDSLWNYESTEYGPGWSQVAWTDDPDLADGIAALRRAAGRKAPSS